MVNETDKRESVRLLTFNTWGLKLVSKHRKQRLRAIADKLANPFDASDDYDVVALQEVWCEEDWQYLDHVCRDRYPFRRYFKAGIISGPGLCVLAKIPITETFLYRFPINGRPSAFFRGDWYVGKSVAVTMFQPLYSGSMPIALLNSHMHAPYGHGDASYSTHRACQAWDFAKIVRMLKKAGYAVIQVGDLNSKPESLPYKIFTIEGGLSDSWNVLHGGKLYIPIRCKGQFTETLPPPLRCSFSDHFAYCVELKVEPRISHANHVEEYSSIERESVYKELLVEINNYRSHTIPFQTRWRKLHFILSILAVIGMHVAIVFVSNVAGWISVLFLFATIVILATGLLNGLIWSLGVRSESRALQEVQMEVEDAFVYSRDHHGKS
ncbi:Endonuclease/Exonuclease/phosphatase family protein [Candida parapsilosis]|uniref:Endonuclease/Exonuclease/phosphatase family protein n=1 Tax=Candida parapsilosis TaxID=5480 RepID=A0A8X7NS15_CANPA|nr:Endonuclease/Exonuclease/phosphatase family protein [Candida parapsilosis]KAF6067775.1 Endonuclease/Exonuclease/phosphatase family protein [Candida parapsilosis]